MKLEQSILIQEIINIARSAGELIQQEYKKPPVVNWKSDDSPLTQADKKSHDHILKRLIESFPEIPVLSEEGVDISYAERSKWDKFWCVDPIDGTKEFIKKTGQYTINIALIQNGEPIIGVIYVPSLSLLYFAEKGSGAFKLDNSKKNGQAEPINVRELNHEEINVVASKDHAGPAVKKLIEALPNATTKSMGSSLKFCLVAEGEADVYYRDVPTFEWDTAAAQAIVEEAGGKVYTLDGRALKYNKKNLRNPSLITFGSDWKFWESRIKM